MKMTMLVKQPFGERAKMAGIESIGHIPEPNLLFGRGGRCVDQRWGLYYFGPYWFSEQEMPHPSTISIGIIGSGETVDLTRTILDRLRQGINPPAGSSIPPFPGFSSDTQFRCGLEVNRGSIELFRRQELEMLKQKRGFGERMAYALELIKGRLRNLSEREPRPDVTIVAMPPEIKALCARGWNRFGKPLRKPRKAAGAPDAGSAQTVLGQYVSVDEMKAQLAEEAHYSSIYRATKVEAMQFDMPTQVLQEGTLTGNGLEDPCTVSWNLAVGLYYKAGGHLWRLANAAQGTCYVGVSFYQSWDDAVRSSMAQVFSHSGEGLVLKGGKADESLSTRSPHLDRIEAQRLLEEVLRTYKSQMGTLPTRVVVHKSSRYWDDEREGFMNALSDIEQWDMVAIEKSDMRLFCFGSQPPVRGTYFTTGNDRTHLYARGYVPFRQTYWGPSTPLPITILEHIGDTPRMALCEEILGLTKMNWNTSAFSIDPPITLFFSKKVGALLSEARENTKHQSRYLYYM